MNKKINWDRVGILTSVLCAIHCIILPILLTSLPVFGINIIHNVIFEWLMICLAFIAGFFALRHGYRKHHYNKLPLIIFTGGFIFLITKQFFPAIEIYFLTPAVIFIISAHLLNIRLWRRHKDHLLTEEV